jgi:hypothetical protein
VTDSAPPVDDTKRPPSRWRRALPHALAAFVLFHVVAMLVLAIPAPSAARDKRAWRDAAVQAELRLWANSLGVEPKALEGALWTLATTWFELRGTLAKPFDRYARALGTRQGWSMFAAPDRFPARLEIAVRDGKDAPWTLVYRSRDDVYAWQRPLFDHDRVRKILFYQSWPGRQALQRRFEAAVAVLAARDFPNATHVRVARIKLTSQSPAERAQGQELVTAIEREQVLPLVRAAAGAP